MLKREKIIAALLYATGGLLVFGVSAALGALTFTSSTITGDSATTIDNAGTLTLGNASATAIAIGKSGITTTVAGILSFTTSTGGSLMIGTSTAASNALLTIATSSNILAVLSNGNVGIGTAAPAAKLHIAGNIYLIGGLVIGTTTPPSGGATTTPLTIENTATNGQQQVIFDNTNAGDAFTELVLGQDTFGAGLQNLLIGYNNSGRIGSFIDNVANSAFIETGPSSTNGLRIGTNAAAPLIFFTNGTAAANERVRITNTGSVGIGTASPSSTLHVIASASSTVYIGSASSSGCLVLGNSNGSGVTYITALGGTLTATTTKPSVCQ